MLCYARLCYAMLCYNPRITRYAMLIYSSQGVSNRQALCQADTLRELSRIIRLNNRVCASAGPVYMHQLSVIYLDLLHLYKLFSEQVIAGSALYCIVLY